MVVYDESGRRIEEYDLDKGYLESKSEAVEHQWVVDSEEQGEWVTLNEYPETGGKDVEWRVTAEEQGHWKTVKKGGGEEVSDFDGKLSDDWPHDVPVPDIFEYAIYHPYTEEELAEIERQREEEERRVQEQRSISEGSKEFFLGGGKEQMEAQIAAGGADPQLQALARMQVMTMNLAPMPASTVAEFRDYWRDWEPGIKDVKQNDCFKYGGGYWRASQDIPETQGIYPPGTSESLYYPITVSSDGVIVYRECHGEYDMVRAGETRHYTDADGPVYRAKVDTAYDPDAVPDNWEFVSDES